VADILQRSLRPPTLPVIAGVEMAAAYCPTGDGIEAGGDFYDVFAPAPERWSVVIGDVCGTGAAAGAVTAQVRRTLRAEARHAHGDVIGVVTAVNDVLVESGRDESFCTLIYGELTEAVSGGIDVTIIAAGHPLPFLVRAGSVSDVGANGLLLGVLTPFVGDPITLHLDAGDALVLVTDGVLEARESDDRRRMFGRAGVEAAITASGAATAAAIASAIEGAVQQFAGDALDDDIAILVVRSER
jgi:serine phosphatase RsbU (regulator of sigma subunit)